MNTIRTEYKNVSGYHTEGGWPKSINFQDPEQVEKHLKKIEMDEGFQDAIPALEEVIHSHLAGFGAK
jgi:dynein intermediate chain 2